MKTPHRPPYRLFFKAASAVLLLALVFATATPAFAKESPRMSPDSAAAPKTTLRTASTIPAESGYWMNAKSGVRHNNHCRYYGKGKNGRPCRADEGKACKICGG